MEWQQDTVSHLIELYREREILWNTSNSNYKNKFKKNDAWCEIAQILSIERGEVENKMKRVIGQFQREQKKSKSGDGRDDVTETKWFAFKSLIFLKDKNKPHQTQEAGLVIQSENTNDKTDLNVTIGNDNDTTIINNTGGQYIEESNLNNSQSLAGHELTVKNKKFSTTNTSKRKNINSMAEEAYKVMNDLIKKVDRDEYQIYGEHVACKIKKLSTPYAQSTVQHLINTILYEAEMGKYNEHNFYQYGNQPHVQNLQVTIPTNTPNNNHHIYQSKSGLSTPIHTPSYEQTTHSITSGLNTADTSLDSLYTDI